MEASLFARLKKKWRWLKSLPPGERFQTVHERQKNAPAWVRPALIAAAVISFAIGVVLSVIPGPAIVFFALAGALGACVSRWVARILDRGELIARRVLSRVKRRMRMKPAR